MTAVKRPLGELEHAIMTVLWTRAPLSGREVLARLHRRPQPAYTTVMTVLDRLHAKGFVERVKDGKAFLYGPTVSREEWTAQNALRALGKDPTTGVLVAFLDSAERADSDLMDRLERLIAARRERGT
ncbi:MAG: BlaI/MecI/CopY family transcriptional regulator [Deltaproteobacteria bacterium]|nr:BlaI/MecI/CopY family transcriptional regulator [Deltaproteobacteria bacterium]